MQPPFSSPVPLTEIEIEAIWDAAAAQITWTRLQMLLAENLDPALEKGDPEDSFRSLFPIATFGSDLWLKRQILPVLCLAHQDVEKLCAGMPTRTNTDPDKYVHLIIPHRHRKFFRLVGELQKNLPWISDVLDPTVEPIAFAVHQRLKHLGLGSKVRIRYADLNEEMFFD